MFSSYWAAPQFESVNLPIQNQLTKGEKEKGKSCKTCVFLHWSVFFSGRCLYFNLDSLTNLTRKETTKPHHWLNVCIFCFCKSILNSRHTPLFLCFSFFNKDSPRGSNTWVNVHNVIVLKFDSWRYTHNLGMETSTFSS